MLKKIKLNISGIYCKSCKILIETEINVLDGVNSILVNYQTGEIVLEFDDKKISLNKIKKGIEKLGYSFNDKLKIKDNDQKKVSSNLKRLFIIGLPILFVLLFLVGGYFLVDKLGGFELLSELNKSNTGYGIIFIIGLLTGFHCVGMCGGIVLAYSSSILKKKSENNKPKISIFVHLQYNLGRIISYTVIGGILGGIGSFFGINPVFTGVVLLFAGIFMILMGLSLLWNCKILKKIKLHTPQFIARYLYNQKYSKKSKGAFLIGILNGFMPCGPLQAIQLYALASGDIIHGAFSLGIYALGTAVLMLGFGLTLSIVSSQYVKKMIKISGVLVMILGIIMINRGLTNFGHGISFKRSMSSENTIITGENQEYQKIEMELTYLGYKPNVLYIKKEIPVRWIINVTNMTGCTNSIMIESLGIKKDLQIGKNIIEFIPPKNVREIKFSCWMRMVWGKFIITEGDISANQKQIEAKSMDLSQNTCSGDGSCGGGCGKSTCGCLKNK